MTTPTFFVCDVFRHQGSGRGWQTTTERYMLMINTRVLLTSKLHWFQTHVLSSSVAMHVRIHTHFDVTIAHFDVTEINSQSYFHVVY